MELKEFVMEIAKGIEARLEGVKVTPTETMKNNGVIQNGVLFRKNDEKISPVLYLDLWFKKFNKGELTLPDVVKRVISDYQELPPHNIPDFEEWISDVDLLDKISIHLVNKKANERMIATRKLVSYEIPETDLIALFYLKVIVDDESVGETAVNEFVMKEYFPDIADAKELFDEALSRIKVEDVKLETMQDVISRLVADVAEEVPELPSGSEEMFVLTNNKMLFGPAVIFSEVARRMILEKIPNGNVTVLPSSVHELILIATSENENVAELREMVLQVNETEVSKSEVLSNNVYHFDANTGKFEMVSWDCDEVEE